MLQPDSGVPSREVTATEPAAVASEAPGTHVVQPAAVVVPAYDPRAERVVWFVTSVVAVVLTMRFMLKLLGASTQSAFVSLLYGVSDPLTLPFQGMFATPGRSGYVFEAASLVALVVYSLIGWAVVALIRIRHSRRRPSP